MEPPFLFPEKGVKHSLGGKTYFSVKANPELSDIPFVRVRGWYEAAFNKAPPSYMQLVNQVQGIAPKPANYPRIKLDGAKSALVVGSSPVQLSPSEFALVYLMLKRIKAKALPYSWYDLEPDFAELLARKVSIPVNWFHTFSESGSPDPEDFRKWASSARSKLRKVFDDPSLANMLLPSMKQRGSHVYPSEKITVREVA